MRSLVPALLMVALAACGNAATSTDGSAQASTDPSTAAEPSASGSQAAALAVKAFGDNGAPLGYLEYLPPDYGDGVATPLLVFLHGAGEAGDGSTEALELVDDLGIPELIADGEWPDDRSFVVLAPQYATRYAEGECGFGDDLAAFLEYATQAYDIDPARIYLTGVSCGAIGIWDYLASHANELVAAAVPISGHALWALEKSGCAPLAEVPIWAFHGADDDVVPVDYVEDQIDEIRACEGADATAFELTVYPETGHVEAINQTYDLSAGNDIYAWLLDHTH